MPNRSTDEQMLLTEVQPLFETTTTGGQHSRADPRHEVPVDLVDRIWTARG